MTWNLVTAAGRFFNRTLLTDVNPAVQTLQQQDQDEWDTTPQLDPIQALLMRGLFHKVLGLSPTPEEDIVLQRFFFQKPPPPFNKPDELQRLETQLAGIGLPPGLAGSLANYKPEYVAALQETYTSLGPGSVHVGRLKDVPKDACYVGRHHNTYVWVTANDIEMLTNLTIAVLDVASTDISAQAGQPTKQPSPKVIQPPVTLTH